MPRDRTSSSLAFDPSIQPNPMVILAFTILVWLTAIFLPSPWFWGLDAWGRLGIVGRGVAIAFVLAVCVPPIRSLCARGLRAFGVALRERPKTCFVAIAVLHVLLATGPLRVATDLHGDALLIVESLEQGARGESWSSMRDPIAAFTEVRTAPLTAALHAAVLHGVVKPAGLEPAWAVRSLSVLAGILWIALVTTVVGRGIADPLVRGAVFVVAVVASASEIFCAYVENYALFQVAVAAYLVALFAWGHGRARVGWVVTSLLLAIALHVQGVLLVPGLLVVALSRSGSPPRWIQWALRGPVLSTLLGIMALGISQVDHPALLPFVADDGVAVLSVAHLRDVLNVLVLLLPVGLWMMVSASQVWDSREKLWMRSLLAPALLYLVVADPVLGGLRDWDRFSFVFVIALAGWVLGSHRVESADSPRVAQAMTVAAVVSAVLACGWILSQASAPVAEARVEQFVGADAASRRHGDEALALHFDRRGDLVAAAAQFERAYATTRNPRLAVLAAQRLRALDRPDEAEVLLARALERRPEDLRVRSELATLLGEQAQWEELLPLCLDGTERHPDEAIFWFFAGESLRRLGRPEPARAMFRRALALPLPPANRAHALAVLDAKGDDDDR